MDAQPCKKYLLHLPWDNLFAPCKTNKVIRSLFLFVTFYLLVYLNYFILFSAMDDFNNGVVLTHRPLKPDELFEVRLDKMVTKWAGSIEIGVTTHSSTELEFPSTMTNVR